MDNENEKKEGHSSQAAGYATGFSDEDRMNLIRAGWTLVRSSRGGYYATNSKNSIECYGNTVNDALDAVLVRLQGDQKSHNHSLPDSSVGYQSPSHENRQNETK